MRTARAGKMVSGEKKISMPQETCERLALTQETKRRLWSESGGYCSNPECAAVLFDKAADVDFAEMAHIIAASSGGPRDVNSTLFSAGDRAHYSNVVILCANCHKKIDKAPSVYPAELLRYWKKRHEETLQRVFGTPQFATRSEARAFVAPMLEGNKTIFEQYGPVSNQFSEARAAQWRRHVKATIVPNNAEIVRVLKQNRTLLGPRERRVADIFDVHAQEFAARHLLGDWTAGSTRFPQNMETIFEGEAA